jgi:hypothetical protein
MDAIINEAILGSMRLQLPATAIRYSMVVEMIRNLRPETPDPDPLDNRVSQWSFEALYLYAEKFILNDDFRQHLHQRHQEILATGGFGAEQDIVPDENPKPHSNGIGTGRFSEAGGGDTREGRIRARMQAAGRILDTARHSGRGMGKLVTIINGDIPRSRTPWQMLLRVPMARHIDTERTRSWRRPSRRGLLEPGRIRSKPAPKIAICLDTSGSIDDDILRIFVGEMAAIARSLGASLHVVVADDGVQDVFDVPVGDPRRQLRNLKVTGRGGTTFQPAIARAAASNPDIIVYFTDLHGPMPEKPLKPLFWAVPESINANPEASVGKIIHLTGL